MILIVEDEIRNKLKQKYNNDVDIDNCHNQVIFEPDFFDEHKYDILNIMYGVIKLSDEQESCIREYAPQIKKLSENYAVTKTYSINDDYEIYRANGDFDSDVVFCHSEHDYPMSTVDDLCEFLYDMGLHTIETQIKDYDTLNDIECYDDIAIALEENGFTMCYVEVESRPSERYNQIFLTKETCEKHIKSNRHHYTNPKCVGTNLFRNHLMENVIDVFTSIGDKL